MLAQITPPAKWSYAPGPTGHPLYLREIPCGFAARGGNRSKGYYSGSNDFHDVAWNRYDSDNAAHPVATKSPTNLTSKVARTLEGKVCVGVSSLDKK